MVDLQEVRAMLDLLGIDPAQAHLRAIHWDKDFEPKEAQAHHLPPTRVDRGPRLEQLQRDSYRLYLLPNGGAHDADVSTCRYLFAEWDDGTSQQQLQLLNQLIAQGLPAPTLVLWSGGKSHHAYWRLDHPMPVDQWRGMIARLIAFCGSDKTCKNPSRLMRLAGSTYLDKKTGQPTGKAVILHHLTNPNRIYSAAAFDFLQEVTPKAPSSPGKAPQHQLPATSPNGVSPRSYAELERLVSSYPTILANNGQRDGALKLVCGLTRAMEEIGMGKDAAIALASQYHPQAADTFEQVDRWKFDQHGVESFIAQCKAAGVDVRRWDLHRTPQVPPAEPFIPLEDHLTGNATINGNGTGNASSKRTDEQRLAMVAQRAAELIERLEPVVNRLPLLRAFADEHGLRLPDNELQRRLWAARRASHGEIVGAGPGDVLNAAPQRWLWKGILLAGCLNLLVGMAKAGKTSLLIAMISAWHRGATEYLGLPLIGPCPPVLVVGVDMVEADWVGMLRAFQLMSFDCPAIQAPIVRLFHKGQPLNLDPEGIEKIEAHAREHPNLLILLDSYAELTRGMGIAEKDSDFAEPISDLMEVVTPYGCTVALLHHSGKERARGTAAEASRGTTALPAIASQCINLFRPAAKDANGSENDPRRIITTEGRGGKEQRLLIERVGGDGDEDRTPGDWISHGSSDAVEQQLKVQEVEDNLNDLQAESLEVVRARWKEQGERSTAGDVVDVLSIRGADPDSAMLRRLKGLARRHLLESDKVATLSGHEHQFWPAGGHDRPAGPAPSCGEVPTPPARKHPDTVGSVGTVRTSTACHLSEMVSNLSEGPVVETVPTLPTRSGCPRAGSVGSGDVLAQQGGGSDTPFSGQGLPSPAPAGGLQTATELVDNALDQLGLATGLAAVAPVLDHLREQGHTPTRNQVVIAMQSITASDAEADDNQTNLTFGVD